MYCCQYFMLVSMKEFVHSTRSPCSQRFSPRSLVSESAADTSCERTRIVHVVKSRKISFRIYDARCRPFRETCFASFSIGIGRERKEKSPRQQRQEKKRSSLPFPVQCYTHSWKGDKGCQGDDVGEGVYMCVCVCVCLNSCSKIPTRQTERERKRRELRKQGTPPAKFLHQGSDTAPEI